MPRTITFDAEERTEEWYDRPADVSALDREHQITADHKRKKPWQWEQDRLAKAAGLPEGTILLTRVH